MSDVRSLMVPLAFASVLAAGSVFGGCVSKDDVDPEASSGSASGGSPTATAGTSSGGVTAGTSASTAGTGGSATTAMPLACATVAKPSGTSPLITDFETMTAATGTYMFEAAFLGGTYAYTDLLSMPVSTSALSLVAGHDAASTKALLAKISNNTWGGGMGLWFTCQDASAYTGVKFWARGISPAGPVRFNLTVNQTLEAKENGPCAGPCTRPNLTFEVTDEWAEHTFAWADFMPGDAAGVAVPPTADTLFGLDFGLTNDNMARELELAVDDFAFTTE